MSSYAYDAADAEPCVTFNSLHGLRTVLRRDMPDVTFEFMSAEGQDFAVFNDPDGLFAPIFVDQCGVGPGRWRAGYEQLGRTIAEGATMAEAAAGAAAYFTGSSMTEM